MGRKIQNAVLHILQAALRVERPDFTTVFVKITHGFAAISRALCEGLGGQSGGCGGKCRNVWGERGERGGTAEILPLRVIGRWGERGERLRAFVCGLGGGLVCLSHSCLICLTIVSHVKKMRFALNLCCV